MDRKTFFRFGGLCAILGIVPGKASSNDSRKEQGGMPNPQLADNSKGNLIAPTYKSKDGNTKEGNVSVPIVFITTFQIENGALEKFKEAVRKSIDFLESNGPQLMAEVCIDEIEMRAHGIQIHRDSESILTHWQLADPHMRNVMQYITTTRVDIYGQPNEAVMEGMRRLSSQGAVLSVTPRFAGFSRLPGIG